MCELSRTVWHQRMKEGVAGQHDHDQAPATGRRSCCISHSETGARTHIPCASRWRRRPGRTRSTASAARVRTRDTPAIIAVRPGACAALWFQPSASHEEGKTRLPCLLALGGQPGGGLNLKVIPLVFWHSTPPRVVLDGPTSTRTARTEALDSYARTRNTQNTQHPGKTLSSRRHVRLAHRLSFSAVKSKCAGLSPACSRLRAVGIAAAAVEQSRGLASDDLSGAAAQLT